MIEFIERQALIIWLYSNKNIKSLRKHGYIHYISRRMKYVVMYVDKAEAEQVAQQIMSYYFVRDVEFSYRDDIDMTFEHSIEPNEGVMIEEDLLLPEDDGSFFEKIAQSIVEAAEKPSDRGL